MGATAVSEAARIRMVMEGGSDERTRAGAEAAPRWQRHLLWGGGGETCDGRSGSGGNGDESGTERVMGSPITPATRGQKGCEYVSTRTHPLTP